MPSRHYVSTEARRLKHLVRHRLRLAFRARCSPLSPLIWAAAAGDQSSVPEGFLVGTGDMRFRAAVSWRDPLSLIYSSILQAVR